MKYVILIHSNPASRRVWDGLSAEERSVGLGAYRQLNEDLAATGEMIVTQALADPATAKRVSTQDGQVLTTDGPFAEVKEHVAGFYLVECESIDRAVEIAARIPEAGLGLVEVRPAKELSEFEM